MSKEEVLDYMRTHGYADSKPKNDPQVCKDLIEIIKRRGVNERLDYGKDDPGDWIPNEEGGRENLEAVAFIKELSDLVHERHPGAILCAEESTTWPSNDRTVAAAAESVEHAWASAATVPVMRKKSRLRM